MVAGFQFIQTLSDLKPLCRQLSSEPVIGVDTEADSLHHYFPKVCLVQISTSKHIFVIDPLAMQTMDPLRPVFASRQTKKILHGAGYDVRLLFRDFAIKVNNLFDTMLASQFIGEKEPSLAAVVKKRFGATLNKKYQRADWSKRPLGHDMMLYAAHDTLHLIRLYRELEQELESKGRLSWVEEECKLLTRTGLEERSSASADVSKQHGLDPLGNGISKAGLPLFRRFKGAGKMVPRDLAVLEMILQFRERIAMEEDRPPFRIFSNRVVQNLVTAKPAGRAALKEVPNLQPDFMSLYAEAVLDAIQSGLQLPEDRLPSFPKTRRPPQDSRKQARLKRLKKWRGHKAAQLEIEAGLICNNLLLDTLAEGNPKDIDDLKAIRGIKAWHRKTFGQEIIQVLNT